MRAFQRIMIIAAVLVGCAATYTANSEAGIIVRRAPVRRVAARAVLPPYPVARRAAWGPVVRPAVVVRPRAFYAAPVVFRPGVSVVVGF